MATHPVASYLQALQSDQRLSLSEFARRIGLDKAELSRLYNGQRQPTLPLVCRLARTLPTHASRLCQLAIGLKGEVQH